MNFDESDTRLRKLQNFCFIFNYLIYKFYQPLFVLYGQVARISVLLFCLLFTGSILRTVPSFSTVHVLFISG